MAKRKYDTYDPELFELYQRAAEKYKPTKIQILVVAESPPPLRNGQPRYFYFDILDKPENLYHGVMTALWDNQFDNSPSQKPFFLKKFCDHDFFLIDSLKFPIYDLQDDTQKINAIKRERRNILEEIHALNPQHVVLVHPRVFAGLYDYFADQELPLLNETPIEFPVLGKDSFEIFLKQFRNAIQKASLG